MSLGFLSPLFLIGLLAAAVPVLLHLFRRQADTVVPFSAVRFLRRAPVEQARRRRVRDLLLLALRTAALVLLALSFARPYLVDSTAAADVPVTVVAIDASLSVSTPAQVSRARDAADRAIREAPAGGLVAVLRFDERAEVVVPPTVDRASVRAALPRVTPGAGGTRYAAVVARAVDLTAGRPARLIVVSDLQRSGWEGAVSSLAPPELEIDAVDIGTAPSNLAVVAVRRSAQGVVAAVRNESDASRTVPVSLAIDGRVQATETVTLEPRRSADVPFALVLPASGALSVRVADADGYAADNERFLVLDPPVRPRVLAVTGAGAAGDAFFLERAVAAVEGAQGIVIERVGMERLVGDPDVLAGYAAVALFTSSGLDRRTAEALGRAAGDGTGILFVAGPSLELGQLAAQLPASLSLAAGRTASPDVPVSFAPVDLRHPLFRPFGAETGLLGGVRFRRFARVQPPDGAAVLARFSDGSPALVELAGTTGHGLLFASDLGNAWNDFARHPAFVPFAHEMIRYLVATRPAARGVRVGELAHPEGDVPGVIEVPVPATTRGAASTRRVAVNTDPRESEHAPMTPAAFAAAVPRTARAAATAQAALAYARESEQAWWRYGLVLMLLGLVAESVVGRRT